MQDHQRGHGLGVVAVLACALALASCTADEPDDAPSATAPAASASGAAASVEGFDAADAVAELEVTKKGDEAVTATIQVLPLQVDGDVMLMRLLVTPRTTDAAEHKNSLGAAMFSLNNGFFSPTLRDLDNLKVYTALSGPGLATNVTEALPWDRPSPVYAYFAAPQDDISTVDLQLAETWPAVTDVPIER